MNTQRNDFLVGLFILIAIGGVVGMAIVTSGWGELRATYYVRTSSAEGLTQDTRVVLRGLDVGRLRDISPIVDSASGSLTCNRSTQTALNKPSTNAVRSASASPREDTRRARSGLNGWNAGGLRGTPRSAALRRLFFHIQWILGGTSAGPS